MNDDKDREKAPQACLADIFARIHDHKINRIDELLPLNWKPGADRAAAA